jgi:hypothetical protein
LKQGNRLIGAVFANKVGLKLKKAKILISGRTGFTSTGCSDA